jgi:hypothetical protein
MTDEFKKEAVENHGKRQDFNVFSFSFLGWSETEFTWYVGY